MSINLSIKGVSDQVADRLRVRAERHHRSLQGELMAIVERAASEDDATPAAARSAAMPGAAMPGAAMPGAASATGPNTAGAAAPTLAQPAAPHGPVLRQGWRSIDDLLADRRERGPLATPPSGGLPLAVDIVRADRDSR